MKKIIGVLLGLLILCMPMNIEAQEDTSTVTISFELTAEDRFIYEVRVSEGGSLYDGSQRITNGIMEYQLGVGETKDFTLEADRGYEIKEIWINQKKLDTDIEKVRIAGVSARSVLEVRYGKIEEPVVPEPDIPDKPDIPTPPDNKNPSGGIEGPDYVDTGNQESGIDSLVPITGDILKVSEYVCLMLIVLYRIYVSRRGIDTVRCVDNIAISMKGIEENGCKETLEEEKEDE